MCNDFPKPQPLNLNVGNTSVASPQMRHDTDPLALSLKSALWPEGAGKGWTRISPMATCPTEHIWDWVRVKLEDWEHHHTLIYTYTYIFLGIRIILIHIHYWFALIHVSLHQTTDFQTPDHLAEASTAANWMRTAGTSEVCDWRVGCPNWITTEFG